MRRVLIAVAAVALALLAVWALARGRSARREQSGGSETVRVEKGAVTLTVSADGILQPLTTVSVKSYAGGRLDLLAVEIGDQVKAGDLIAKIDPTESLASYNQAVADLDAARARLRQSQELAQVQPALTRAAIAQAEAQHRSAAQDLERMSQATHPQTRAQARAALDRARANLEVAERDLERVKGLREQGFVPPSELDAAENKREVARADLAAAQERWDRLEEELGAELEAAKARVAQTQAALDRARTEAVQDRIKQADVVSAEAQVARAEAQVENARTLLDYTVIRAPRSGVILDRFVEEGTIVTGGRGAVTQGTDIALLGDLSRVFAEVSLDEAEVSRVRVGQPVNIQVDAFPRAALEGVVTRINPQAVTQQNVTTVLVTVEVENPDARLKPGMTAVCEFRVEEVAEALFVPSRALWMEQGSSMVSVLRDEETVNVPVTVGLVGNERTEIREGVREGDVVVLPRLASPGSGGDSFRREMGRRAAGGGAFFRGR